MDCRDVDGVVAAAVTQRAPRAVVILESVAEFVGINEGIVIGVVVAIDRKCLVEQGTFVAAVVILDLERPRAR